MPPVRDASTKPSAATVLPAPVACSNQKRRAALGSSSSCVGSALLLLFLGLVPVERLLVCVDVLVALDLLLAGGELLDLRVAAVAVSVAHSGGLRLGQQRDQRAGERINLVGGQRRAVREVGLLLGHAAARGRAAASTRLRHSTDGRSRPSSISASAASSAPAARRASASATADVLALEQERLEREFLGALKIIARNRRGCDGRRAVSHRTASRSKRVLKWRRLRCAPPRGSGGVTSRRVAAVWQVLKQQARALSLQRGVSVY